MPAPSSRSGDNWRRLFPVSIPLHLLPYIPRIFVKFSSSRPRLWWNRREIPSRAICSRSLLSDLAIANLLRGLWESALLHFFLSRRDSINIISYNFFLPLSLPRFYYVNRITPLFQSRIFSSRLGRIFVYSSDSSEWSSSKLTFPTLNLCYHFFNVSRDTANRFGSFNSWSPKRKVSLEIVATLLKNERMLFEKKKRRRNSHSHA